MCVLPILTLTSLTCINLFIKQLYDPITSVARCPTDAGSGGFVNELVGLKGFQKGCKVPITRVTKVTIGFQGLQRVTRVSEGYKKVTKRFQGLQMLGKGSRGTAMEPSQLNPTPALPRTVAKVTFASLSKSVTLCNHFSPVATLCSPL